KLRERGRIEEGYFADIVVINRGKLKSNATFEIENRYSEGVEYSLVNGVLAIDNGKATDQRAGKILRRV
ncbi:MAG: D-aminoacylase, partial [Proteobacteria bacterium]|nr:D-aminoacylase [Pseudomonadota bacterium]